VNVVKALNEMVEKNSPKDWNRTFDRLFLHQICHDKEISKEIVKRSLYDINNSVEVDKHFKIETTDIEMKYDKKSLLLMLENTFDSIAKDSKLPVLKLTNEKFKNKIPYKEHMRDRILGTNKYRKQKISMHDVVGISLMLVIYLVVSRGRFDKERNKFIFETNKGFTEYIKPLLCNYLDIDYNQLNEKQRNLLHFYANDRIVKRINTLSTYKVFDMYKKSNKSFRIEFDKDKFFDIMKYLYWDVHTHMVKLIKFPMFKFGMDIYSYLEKEVTLSKSPICKMVSKLYLIYMMISFMDENDINKIIADNSPKKDDKIDNAITFFNQIIKSIFKFDFVKRKYIQRAEYIIDESGTCRFKKIKREDIIDNVISSNVSGKFKFTSKKRLKQLVTRLWYDAVQGLREFLYDIWMKILSTIDLNHQYYLVWR